jgi:hypothetical protein
MSPRAACRLEALGYHRAYDYVDGIADWTASGLPTEGTAGPGPRVIDATRSDVPTCQPSDTIGGIRSTTVDADWEVCVVTDCDGMAIGRIRGDEFDADPDLLVIDVMESGPSTVRPDQPLQSLVERMQQRDAPNVIVTTPQGKLLGILLRDEAERLLAGDPPHQIWRDCECCPGRWTISRETR